MNLRIINTSIGRTHVPELLSSTRRGVVAKIIGSNDLYSTLLLEIGALDQKKVSDVRLKSFALSLLSRTTGSVIVTLFSILIHDAS